MPSTSEIMNLLNAHIEEEHQWRESLDRREQERDKRMFDYLEGQGKKIDSIKTFMDQNHDIAERLDTSDDDIRNIQLNAAGDSGWKRFGNALIQCFIALAAGLGGGYLGSRH